MRWFFIRAFVKIFAVGPICAFFSGPICVHMWLKFYSEPPPDLPIREAARSNSKVFHQE